MYIRNAIFLFISLVVITNSASTQEVDYEKYGIDIEVYLPQGIEVGRKAPLFSSTDQDGKSFNLEETLSKRPVVLIFYRGVWCPVCVRYLKNLQDSLNLIVETGAVVVAITPEDSANVSKTSKKTGAEFIILSDKSEEIMRNYDVWFEVTSYYQTKVNVGRLDDIAVNNEKETARLPVPATFIINRNGIIVYRQFDYNYKNRASVAEIITVLKNSH